MGIFIVSVNVIASGEVRLALYDEFYLLLTTTAFYIRMYLDTIGSRSQRTSRFNTAL
jgi:hypothetical protein